MSRAFGGAGRLVEARRTSPAINIAPLIDVQFLLLIFLLVSTTFKVQPALDVSLPQARSAQPRRTDRLAITVRRDGTYSLAGDWVARHDLAQRLRSLRTRLGDRPVTLRVDRRAASGSLVFALDAARQAGYKQVILPTVDAQERDRDAGDGEP